MDPPLCPVHLLRQAHCIRYPRVGTGRCVYLRPRLEEEALASQLPGAVVSSGSPLFSAARLRRNYLPDFSSPAAIALMLGNTGAKKPCPCTRSLPRKIYIPGSGLRTRNSPACAYADSPCAKDRCQKLN